jgi:hypothetical protein
MSVRTLPASPDIEQYKKQPKELVKDCAAAAPEALERIRHRHPRFHGLPVLDIQRRPFRLSDAQLTIAREHEFETWSKFAAHIQMARATRSKTSPGEAVSAPTTENILVGGIELEAVLLITFLASSRMRSLARSKLLPSSGWTPLISRSLVEWRRRRTCLCAATS